MAHSQDRNRPPQAALSAEGDGRPKSPADALGAEMERVEGLGDRVMSERKIKVPEGMTKAALDAYWAAKEPSQEYPTYILEAALRATWDLRWEDDGRPAGTTRTVGHNNAVLEAYRRGRESR